MLVGIHPESPKTQLSLNSTWQGFPANTSTEMNYRQTNMYCPWTVWVPFVFNMYNSPPGIRSVAIPSREELTGCCWHIHGGGVTSIHYLRSAGGVLLLDYSSWQVGDELLPYPEEGGMCWWTFQTVNNNQKRCVTKIMMGLGGSLWCWNCLASQK